MLRSEPTGRECAPDDRLCERLEAWATSGSLISHSLGQYRQHMARGRRRPRRGQTLRSRHPCNPVLGHQKIAVGFDMDRVRIAVAATMMALSGPAFAQTPSPASPPPPDFSKVEIRTTSL